MRNNVCEKKFPRAFRDVTEEIDDAYVELARPDNGITIVKKGTTFHNGHCVAFFPLLSRLLDCHCNGEVVRNLTNPKYLYK